MEDGTPPRWYRLAKALALRAERALARRPARPARGLSTADGLRPVTFFVWNVFAMGGTVRTVLRQSTALADRGHAVTIVSVIRHSYQTDPFFTIDPRARVEVLVDRQALRTASGPTGRILRWLDARPAPGTQISWGRQAQGSLATEVRVIWRVLRARGVLIGTRVGLNVAIARFGHPTALKAAQEHLDLSRYDPILQQAMSRHFRRLDVLACLTEQGAAAYRRALEGAQTAVVVVPNAIPDEFPEPADPAAHRIVAVGRLAPGKGFAQLIKAFALVAPRHPTWTLRVVGDGPQRKRLGELIEQHGLEGRVELRPGTPAVDEELRAASVFALSSSFESFGMVLLEAMAAGLAVVSYDCEHGPREILTDGETALLARTGDVRALSEALDRAMGDRRLREQLARAGREDVRRFTVSHVTDRWAALLDGEHPVDAAPPGHDEVERRLASERTSPANVFGSQPVNSSHRSSR